MRFKLLPVILLAYAVVIAKTDDDNGSEKPPSASTTSEKPPSASTTPETTDPLTDPPKATDPPTDPPKATDPPTDPPKATDPPTDPPKATDPPTDPPKATDSQTDPPIATDPPTEPPKATDPPTEPPKATDPPTEPPKTTDPPTDPPETTDPPKATDPPTDPPKTTDPTKATDPPTDPPKTTDPTKATDPPTDPPKTTDPTKATDPPKTTDPTKATDPPTDPPKTTNSPTDPPKTTNSPTNSPAPPIGNDYPIQISNGDGEPPCILANMNITLTVTYETTEDEKKQVVVYVPGDAKANGTCGDTTSNMTLSWPVPTTKPKTRYISSFSSLYADTDNKITFRLRKDDSRITVDKIEIEITLDETQFPSAKNKTLTVTTVENLGLFATSPEGKKYVCDVATSVTTASEDVKLSITDVKLIAFNNNDDLTEILEENCVNDEVESANVGAIVGGVIAAIVVVGVVGFIIWRRRKNSYAHSEVP